MNSTQKPHFYMIIHPSIFTHGHPAIPQAFLREYGDSLSSSVLIHLPTGAEWRVYLLKLINGEVLFGGGWERFADFYSIEFGHFLLFRYEGCSRFHVFIFDSTASEIEYAAATPADNHSHLDDSVEILDDLPSRQTRRNYKSPSDEMLNHNGASSLLEVEEVHGDFTSTHKTRKISSKNGSSRPPKACSSRAHVNSIPNFWDGAHGRPESFKSENPFFIVTMQRSYVGDRFSLTAPLKFFRRHFQSDTHHIMLSVSDGRGWSVKCSWTKNNIKFSTGWRTFVQDNSLKLGDVCAFELIKSTIPALKVVVFRNNE